MWWYENCTTVALGFVTLPAAAFKQGDLALDCSCDLIGKLTVRQRQALTNTAIKISLVWLVLYQNNACFLLRRSFSKLERQKLLYLMGILSELFWISTKVEKNQTCLIFSLKDNVSGVKVIETSLEKLMITFPLFITKCITLSSQLNKFVSY